MDIEVISCKKLTTLINEAIEIFDNASTFWKYNSNGKYENTLKSPILYYKNDANMDRGQWVSPENSKARITNGQINLIWYLWF